MTTHQYPGFTSLRKVIAAITAVALLVTACSVTASVPTAEVGSGAPADISVGADTLPADLVQPDPEPASADPVQPDPAQPDLAPVDPDPVTPSSERRPVPGDVAPGTAVVYLLDPGAEPRTELRLNIAPSCGEVLTSTQTQELTQVIDGLAQPSAGPVSGVVEMSVGATPNGDNYDVRAEITSARSGPDTPAAIAQAIDAELAQIIGLTVISTMTDRAVQVPGSTQLIGGEVLGPFAELVESVSQAQSPLPLEAVGVGAIWEVISVVDIQGANVATISEVELVSIDGTVVDLRAETRQEVAVGAEITAEGQVITVEEWDVTSSDTTTIDLATISPISLQSVAIGTQRFSSDTSITAFEIVQEVRTKIDIVGVPDDGCTGRSINP